MKGVLKKMKVWGFSFKFGPTRAFSRRLYAEKGIAICDLADFILSDDYIHRDEVIADFGELTVEELGDRLLDKAFASDFSEYAEIEDFEIGGF